MLNEVSQRKTNSVCSLFYMKSNINKEAHRHKAQIGGSQKWGVGEMGELFFILIQMRARLLQSCSTLCNLNSLGGSSVHWIL